MRAVLPLFFSVFVFVTILLPFYFYLNKFPVLFWRFGSKVGAQIPFQRQKLDKSGTQVYTVISFSVGNKSYKLFLVSEAAAQRSPAWAEKPFQEVWF